MEFTYTPSQRGGEEADTHKVLHSLSRVTQHLRPGSLRLEPGPSNSQSSPLYHMAAKYSSHCDVLTNTLKNKLLITI